MSLPELSIVIAAQGSTEETRRCLESLANQADTNPDQIEVIVEGNSPGVEGSAPAQARSLPRLHGTGMQKARAALIAITEAHCTFPPTWGATAIKLHACHPACAIGGMVLPGPHLNGMNFALFLCDYIQFLPPVESVSSADLPGNNIVFKRECLPAGSDMSASGFWKTFYCHQLELKGQDLRIEPALSIFYNRNLSLTEIVARRYHHGRCFGGMRAQSSSLVKRAILFAAGLALPILLLAKLFSRASKKTDGLKLVFRHLGWVWLFLTIWAYGEWIGNLLGSGNSCDQL
jgi:hypothetical protein